MATETLYPNGDDNGWPTGNYTDIDESTGSPDAAVMSTTVEDDVLVLDLDDSAIADGDTVSKIDIVVRGRSTGAGGKDSVDVELLIGGSPVGTTYNTGNLTGSHANYTADGTTQGWTGDRTAAELDGMQVRLTARQAGKNEAATWEIDSVDVIVTYTTGGASQTIGQVVETDTAQAMAVLALQTGAYGDGANDWLDAMTLAGASGTQVAGFTFLKPDSGITEGRWFQAFEGRALMRINGESGGKYKANIVFLTSALGKVLDVETDYVITPAAWNVIFYSYDSATQTLRLRDQNGDIENTGYGGRQLNTGTIDLNVEFSVFAAVNGSFKFPGALGPFLFTNEAVDWSAQANVDKVIDGDGYPNLAALGADGSGLTGTQPLIWLRADYANFHTNYGSGGDFTVNGALDDELTLPQVSGSQTIAIGQVTEADTAQALTFAGSLAVAIGQVTEADTAQALTPSQATVVAIGQVTEADTAQALAFAGALTVAIGQVTEADTAQALGVSQATVVAIGQVIEGDTAQALAFAGSLTVAVGQVAEADTAQGLTPSQATVVAISQVIEGDTPQALTAGQATVVAIGQAVEADTAQGLAFAGSLAVAIGQVTEADTAQGLTPDQAAVVAIGQVTEADTGQGLTPVAGALAAPIGQVTEADTAPAMAASQANVVAIGQVVETDTAQALGIAAGAIAQPVGQIAETDAAAALTAISGQAPGDPGSAAGDFSGPGGAGTITGPGAAGSIRGPGAAGSFKP